MDKAQKKAVEQVTLRCCRCVLTRTRSDRAPAAACVAAGLVGSPSVAREPAGSGPTCLVHRVRVTSGCRAVCDGHAPTNPQVQKEDGDIKTELIKAWLVGGCCSMVCSCGFPRLC